MEGFHPCATITFLSTTTESPTILIMGCKAVIVASLESRDAGHIDIDDNAIGLEGRRFGLHPYHRQP